MLFCTNIGKALCSGPSSSCMICTKLARFTFQLMLVTIAFPAYAGAGVTGAGVRPL